MNIVPRKENQLTKENILKHVSEFDILCRVWPADHILRLDRGAIPSPFRTDKEPSLLIGMVDNRVRYVDLGDKQYKGGSVFKLVQQLKWLKDLNEVLQWIDEAFQLGYSNNKPIVGKAPVVTWEQPKVEPKPPTRLQIVTRKFNKEELDYWNLFHQDISDLKREHIYATKQIWRNGKLQPNELLTFGYYMPDIEKWKIYRPYAPKRTPDTPPHLWKWDNSIGSLQYVENLGKMIGTIGMIVKSRKDRLVVRKATGIDSICSVQAEDMSALSDDTLYDIWLQCQYRYIVADSDKKGKQFSWAMCTEHGYRHINTPDTLAEKGIKDVADMARVCGMKEVTNMFKNKIGTMP